MALIFIKAIPFHLIYYYSFTTTEFLKEGRDMIFYATSDEIAMIGILKCVSSVKLRSI